MSQAGAQPPELDAEEIVAAFNRHQVKYVTIGAFAALAQGATVPPTKDIDFTPAVGRDNLARLSEALNDLDARIRTDAVAGGLVFSHNAESLARSAIWNLTCPHGEFDLSFRPSGTEGYEDLARAARHLRLGRETLPVADLADIIRSKEAAGRPKDLRALPVLISALRHRQEREQARPQANPAQDARTDFGL